MSDRTIRAIVLSRRELGESDRWLCLLSEEEGKLDVIARGSRKAGSRLAGCSDPLTLSKLGLAGARRNLYVTQAQPEAAFRGLRGDYSRLCCAMAFCELLSSVLPMGEPSPEAFELCLQTLFAMEKAGRAEAVLVWAELKLLEISGFLPEFGRCVDTGGELKNATPWVSPSAGGCVSEAGASEVADKFRVRIEVAWGLDKTAALDEPPERLKFALESLELLLRFWRHFLERALPANEACLSSLAD